jgi:predicted permease
MTGWLRRVRARIRHRRFERDVAEELQFHRAAKEAELSSAGLGADEARWQASREMGNVTLMREEARAVWLAPWLESVWQDVRYASRQFRAHPAFTATAIITLLLAIGLNTTLFTVFNAIALRSWPVSDPDSVVLVSGAPQMTRQGRSDGISFAEHRFLRSHATSFSGLVAMRRKGARIGRGSTGEAEFVQACFVSDDFFQVLGVGMELGRGFVREEGAPGAPRAVVVISEGLWRRQFGANPTAIGRTISINEVAFTVVGVAARRFTGPHPIQRYDVFMPLPAMALGWNVEADEFDNAERCCADVIGRLAPGVGATRAAAELDALSRRFRASWKLRPARIVLDGTSVMASAAARNRLAPVFSLMFAGVFLVLLVACANIGNLQLARAFSRRREIGVRLALGASRRRVVRQLCTESLMLALVAGGFAAGVAWVLPGAIVGLSRSADEVSLTLAPDWCPRWWRPTFPPAARRGSIRR